MNNSSWVKLYTFFLYIFCQIPASPKLVSDKYKPILPVPSYYQASSSLGQRLPAGKVLPGILCSVGWTCFEAQ